MSTEVSGRPGDTEQPDGQPAEQPPALPVVQWRGRYDRKDAESEQAEAEVPAGRPHLRAEARQLLLELIRPYRRQVLLLLAVVIGQVVATMAAPLLIGMAIDHGLPDAVDGNYRTLLQLTGALGFAAASAGVLQLVFLRRTGEVGQAVLFDLRRRVFDHTQRLSVSWHERFTSGKVISRLTSDVDTLRELLDASLDGLLLAVLNVVVITVLMLVLDPWLALLALAAIIPLLL